MPCCGQRQRTKLTSGILVHFQTVGIGWEILLLCDRYSAVCFVLSAQTEISPVCAELLFRKRGIYLFLFYVFLY
jgi:hypothetical protein